LAPALAELLEAVRIEVVGGANQTMDVENPRARVRFGQEECAQSFPRSFFPKG